MEKMNEQEFRKAVLRTFENRYRIQSKEEMDHVNQLVDHVLEKFNGTDRADDDDIEPDLRGIFYMLEEMDLLKMDITEKHIIDGRVWKNHYWLQNNDLIERLNLDVDEMIEDPVEASYNIYDNLSSDVWKHYSY